MKNFKRIIALVIAIALCVACAACAKKTEEETKTTYVVLDEKLEAEEYGIAFAKGNNALGLKVAEVLDELGEEGKITEICNKWFGEDTFLYDAEMYDPDLVAAADDTSLQDVLDAGQFIVGLDDSFPPMGYRDDNNEIVGFDCDLAAAVAEKLGVELVLQPIDWDSKEMELESGAIDSIWNGLSVTDERLESMLIVKPYLANAQVVIVPEGSGITKLADLEGKTVALQKGSSALDALMGAEVYDKIGSVDEYADNVTAFMDLQSGREDAFAVDEVVGRYLITEYAE